MAVACMPTPLGKTSCCVASSGVPSEYGSSSRHVSVTSSDPKMPSFRMTVASTAYLPRQKSSCVPSSCVASFCVSSDCACCHAALGGQPRTRKRHRSARHYYGAIESSCVPSSCVRSSCVAEYKSSSPCSWEATLDSEIPSFGMAVLTSTASLPR